MNIELERQQILQKVLAFLSQKHASDETSFDASTRLSETGLIDSFAVLEVVMFLEEDFGLTLSRADLQYIETPETITTLILNKQAVSE
jgi:acyl carrier protein